MRKPAAWFRQGLWPTPRDPIFTVSFILFSPTHLLTVAVVLGVSVLLPLWVRRNCSDSQGNRVAVGLGILVVAHEIVKAWLRVTVYDHRFAEVLPFHLCSTAIMATAVLMLSRSRLAYELAYFWGFSGTLQAILTPDLEEPFPHPLYLSYFLTHGLIILGALYGTLVFRFRPSPRSMVRVYVVTAIYSFALIAPLNLVLDTNYVYLRHKPAGASLLDYLGPWPWYMAVVAVLAWLFFAAAYAPFYVMDCMARRRGGPVKG